MNFLANIHLVETLLAAGGNHLLLSLDWRFFAILLANFPLYCWLGRVVFGSYEAFFDSFPYVRGEINNRREGLSLDQARIVQPDYPSPAPWRLLACTVVYFGLVAAQYTVVRLLFGPIPPAGS
jgi:hypothetical protein